MMFYGDIFFCGIVVCFIGPIYLTYPEKKTFTVPMSYYIERGRVISFIAEECLEPMPDCAYE